MFPAHLRDGPEEAVQANWLCDQALDRLSLGTVGEVQRFWGAMDAGEAKAWADTRDLVPVEVVGAGAGRGTAGSGSRRRRRRHRHLAAAAAATTAAAHIDYRHSNNNIIIILFRC